VTAATSNPTSEDKSETVTNFLLINFLYLLGELENSVKNSKRGTILFRYVYHQVPCFLTRYSADHDHFAIMLEGKACGSENDGSGWRSRWSESARQRVKSGRVPLCSLEVIYIYSCQTNS
jgi:hypothetical protein